LLALHAGLGVPIHSALHFETDRAIDIDMEQVEVAGKRRMQILATGLLPLIALGAILGMASAYGMNLFTVFTTAERRDGANYVMVTKVFGLPVNSRPATQADLIRHDASMTAVKIAVLGVSGAVFIVAIAMCFASITGRPRTLLLWFHEKLGTVQWSSQRLR
jgi:hypothetical protein